MQYTLIMANIKISVNVHICSDENEVLLHDTVIWIKIICNYRLVVGQIDELLIYCKYGIRQENGIYVVDPTGCQEQIAIGNYGVFLGNFSRYISYLVVNFAL